MRSSPTVLAVLVAASCATPPAPVGGATRLDVEGLPNLARVDDHLYRGGQPSEEGFRWLADHGFRTVISLRYFHDESDEVREHGMRPVHIPMFAAHESEAPTPEQLQQFLSLATDRSSKTYFHCLHGSDRTGTMAAIYRIEVDGWDNDRAIQEMQHFGYHDWYRDLIHFVAGYRPQGAAAARYQGNYTGPLRRGR